MSDVWLRIAIIAGTFLAVFLVVAMTRRHRAGAFGPSPTDMSPGVYLFTSGTCADCMPAREQLLEKLGPAGFQEIEWEQDPDLFARAGIDVVPCTLLVGADGDATRFPGMPDWAIQRLSP